MSYNKKNIVDNVVFEGFLKTLGPSTTHRNGISNTNYDYIRISSKNGKDDIFLRNVIVPDTIESILSVGDNVKLYISRHGNNNKSIWYVFGIKIHNGSSQFDTNILKIVLSGIKKQLRAYYSLIFFVIGIIFIYNILFKRKQYKQAKKSLETARYFYENN